MFLALVILMFVGALAGGFAIGYASAVNDMRDELRDFREHARRKAQG